MGKIILLQVTSFWKPKSSFSEVVFQCPRR